MLKVNVISVVNMDLYDFMLSWEVKVNFRDPNSPSLEIPNLSTHNSSILVISQLHSLTLSLD